VAEPISVAISHRVMAVAGFGAGFSPSSVRPGSNTLMNMRERMSALGGGIEFESSVPNGARVVLHLPLAKLD
jgi:signal transduction histidine kinase